MQNEAGTGILWLVVGPSGAGKDSLLDGAKELLRESPQHVFVRRDITRPAEAGGEDHNPVSVEIFESKRNRGEYSLSWGAHGLFYGVPASIEVELARGAHVIVNVSRSVIDEARERFQDVRVINISVPRDVLESRLRSRGRETEQDILRRLDRAESVRLEGPDVIQFSNDRPLEESVADFTALIAR
ncbi:phosphonate metabolism protein/1,5-bisphosphokinase (PRPP-forming) PhnN [Nisaea acidiphila]|uniref:Ribose 1,5-bisphosphate phosphokinase PhnN n=1 Tax=Nisaea acidiphila TaxID=1862145 RepID=A0A9J7AQW8_9PROT|nr:phosphonate metabolism protein/1,5-bisphosphokinase (PRPP-forming) PhnN [Nisaea acidiphila]UUX50003.1 phosphonate metabolism protein/1,5-bisphosphokinase (PRPP-forming) PhnN [Nisaea acidiphila]